MTPPLAAKQNMTSQYGRFVGTDYRFLPLALLIKLTVMIKYGNQLYPAKHFPANTVQLFNVTWCHLHPCVHIEVTLAAWLTHLLKWR